VQNTQTLLHDDAFPSQTACWVTNMSLRSTELTELATGSHGVGLPKTSAFVSGLFLVLYYGTRTMLEPSPTCCLQRNSIPTTD